MHLWWPKKLLVLDRWSEVPFVGDDPGLLFPHDRIVDDGFQI
jgi:hypothetical protein